MIDAAFKRRNLLQATDFHPAIDRIVDYIEENPGVIDRETFVDHIVTLYAAVSIFWACWTNLCVLFFK